MKLAQSHYQKVLNVLNISAKLEVWNIINSSITIKHVAAI
jgi:hypothetical protein